MTPNDLPLFKLTGIEISPSIVAEPASTKKPIEPPNLGKAIS